MSALPHAESRRVSGDARVGKQRTGASERFTNESVIVIPHTCRDGWVCEEAVDRGWPHDDCVGPGLPCPVCNRFGERAPTFDALYASTSAQPVQPAPFAFSLLAYDE